MQALRGNTTFILIQAKYNIHCYVRRSNLSSNCISNTQGQFSEANSLYPMSSSTNTSGQHISTTVQQSLRRPLTFPLSLSHSAFRSIRTSVVPKGFSYRATQTRCDGTSNSQQKVFRQTCIVKCSLTYLKQLD